MRVNSKYILLTLIAFATLVGCHTYIFQPVEKQIVGTWIKSPQSGGVIEEWTFEDDNTLRISRYENGNFIGFVAYCGKTPDIEWKVENKITKHFLYTDDYAPFCDYESPRWLIIKITSSELYLSSEFNKKIRGSLQYGFVKK